MSFFQWLSQQCLLFEWSSLITDFDHITLSRFLPFIRTPAISASILHSIADRASIGWDYERDLHCCPLATSSFLYDLHWSQTGCSAGTASIFHSIAGRMSIGWVYETRQKSRFCAWFLQSNSDRDREFAKRSQIAFLSDLFRAQKRTRDRAGYEPSTLSMTRITPLIVWSSRPLSHHGSVSGGEVCKASQNGCQIC